MATDMGGFAQAGGPYLVDRFGSRLQGSSILRAEYFRQDRIIFDGAHGGFTLGAPAIPGTLTVIKTSGTTTFYVGADFSSPAPNTYVFGSKPANGDTFLIEYFSALPTTSPCTLWSDPNFDPYWSNVVALLYFNGTTGSTTITDETGLSWSAVGSASIVANSGPFSGTGSLSLTSTSDGAKSASSAGFTMGTDDFTCECWAQMPASLNSNEYNSAVWLNSTKTVFMQIDQRSRDPRNWGLYTNGEYCQIGIQQDTAWHHYAWVRASGVNRIYVNGSQSSPVTDNVNYSSLGYAIVGFPNLSGIPGMLGNIAQVRITKGVARYTSAFTPPTQPFPNH